MNQHKKYRLSYTAGALLLTETLNVSKIYNDSKSWDIAKTFANSANVSNSRTGSATKRYISEIITRLKSLSEEEISILNSDLSHDSKKQIVWIAICKTYYFISDFLEEVVCNKISKLDFKLENYDYDRFYLNKAQWHDELENLSTSSKYKVKQVLFKMLKQMDIIDEDGNISEVKPTNEILSLYSANNNEINKWFPTY